MSLFNLLLHFKLFFLIQTKWYSLVLYCLYSYKWLWGKSVCQINYIGVKQDRLHITQIWNISLILSYIIRTWYQQRKDENFKNNKEEIIINIWWKMSLLHEIELLLIVEKIATMKVKINIYPWFGYNLLMSDTDDWMLKYIRCVAFRSRCSRDMVDKV